MSLLFLSLTTLISYLLSLTPVIILLPQLIALLSILFYVFIKSKISTIYLISFIINLIIFSQNGVQSPLFFLIYFLLFIVAFQFTPQISLSFSIITVIFLLYSTNSVISLIPVISLLFITPIVWLISRQQQTIAVEETDFLMWLNLKFKPQIANIIDLTSQLHSTPLNYSQKEQVKRIRANAKSLFKSSEILSKEISDDES